ncbi:MAG: hypothetical protein QXS27_03765 [Candidatus Jordarchaeaceae archaeon]
MSITFEQLKYLVEQYGQRQTARMTGIPRTTIQNYLKRESVPERREARVEMAYLRHFKNELERKGMPEHIVTKQAERIRTSTPKEVRQDIKTWDRIVKKIEKERWLEHIHKYNKAQEKLKTGKKLTKAEEEIIKLGLTKKARQKQKERMLRNLMHTKKDFATLKEIYA